MVTSLFCMKSTNPNSLPSVCPPPSPPFGSSSWDAGTSTVARLADETDVEADDVVDGLGSLSLNDHCRSPSLNRVVSGNEENALVSRWGEGEGDGRDEVSSAVSSPP